jgi:hypothetical protein
MNSKIFYPTIISVLLGLFIFFQGCKSKTISNEKKLNVDYLFTAESVYNRIEIKDKKLIYTYFEDITNKCAQWIQQSPCWSVEDLKSMETELTVLELDELEQIIEQSNFFSLDSIYGGASDGQRYYPYHLYVACENKSKNVMYQSFPGASNMPVAFSAIQEKLYKMINNKFNLKDR